MQNIKELAKKVITKTVSNIVDSELYGWPPPCIGIYYQPERPAAIDQADEAEKC